MMHHDGFYWIVWGSQPHFSPTFPLHWNQIGTKENSTLTWSYRKLPIDLRQGRGIVLTMQVRQGCLLYGQHDHAPCSHRRDGNAWELCRSGCPPEPTSEYTHK